MVSMAALLAKSAAVGIRAWVGTPAWPFMTSSSIGLETRSAVLGTMSSQARIRYAANAPLAGVTSEADARRNGQADDTTTGPASALVTRPAGPAWSPNSPSRAENEGLRAEASGAAR